jgi:hypothetical protein
MKRHTNSSTLGRGKPFFVKKCYEDGKCVIADPREALLFIQTAVETNDELEIVDCLMLRNGTAASIYPI